MTKKLLKQLPVLFSIFLFTTCNVINPEEDIPAYVHVKSFDLTTVNSTQGSASSRITDVWLYQDINFLGAFELPATIPILASGTQNITVFPGIRDNGISALPDIYPFYTIYETEIELEPGVVDSIQPATFYASNTRFMLTPQEGFEGFSHQIQDEIDGNTNTGITISDRDVFDGSASGWAHLDQDNTTLGVGSVFFTEFPPNATSVYMEMNYKTEVELVIGIVGYDVLGQEVYSSFTKGVNVKDEWNKIYFNFTDDIRTIGASTSTVERYQFCIHAQLRGDQQEADIYLDNIKWLQVEG